MSLKIIIIIIVVVFFNIVVPSALGFGKSDLFLFLPPSANRKKKTKKKWERKKRVRFLEILQGNTVGKKALQVL